jgi:Protein of unknown function (DUF1326)
MGYDVSGTFHEACDCEVICSCWVEIPPRMGTCTGLYIWTLEGGKIEGVEAKGARVAAISYGPTCDEAEALLIVIDTQGAPVVPFDALSQAVQKGPWGKVIHPPSPHTGLPVMGKFVCLQVRAGTISRLGNRRDHWQIAVAADPQTGDTAVSATAMMTFTKAKSTLRGGPKDGLLDRATGQEASIVDVGQIETVTRPGAAGPVGLDILADVRGTGQPYRIDLDVTTVTAMRGKFRYVNP